MASARSVLEVALVAGAGAVTDGGRRSRRAPRWSNSDSMLEADRLLALLDPERPGGGTNT